MALFLWLKGFDSHSNFAVWWLFSMAKAYVCDGDVQNKQTKLYVHACMYVQGYIYP